MRRSAFPITIQLEVESRDGEWVVMSIHLCKNIDSLYDKYKSIKSLYMLENKSYRIILILQSKLNSQV
jgi:hypothetical protein